MVSYHSADSGVRIDSEGSEPTRLVSNPTAGGGFVAAKLGGNRTSTSRGGVTRTMDDPTNVQIEHPATRFGARPSGCRGRAVCAPSADAQRLVIP